MNAVSRHPEHKNNAPSYVWLIKDFYRSTIQTHKGPFTYCVTRFRPLLDPFLSLITDRNKSVYPPFPCSLRCNLFETRYHERKKKKKHGLYKAKSRPMYMHFERKYLEMLQTKTKRVLFLLSIFYKYIFHPQKSENRFLSKIAFLLHHSRCGNG